MNYKKIHDEIIARGQSRATTRKAANNLLGGYCEEHHIIPTCIGGLDDKNNLVFLSAREHYIIHQLLVKIYPGNKQISFACFMMTVDKYGHRINNRLYEWVKKQHAANISKTRKGKTKKNDSGVAIQAAQLEGRTADNDSGRAAAAEKMKGRNKNNHPGIAATVEKMTNRTKDNHPGVAKTVERLRGRIKIPEEVNIEIHRLRTSGMSRQDIQDWLSLQGFYACHSTITAICRRVEKTLHTNKN